MTTTSHMLNIYIFYENSKIMYTYKKLILFLYFQEINVACHWKHVFKPFGLIIFLLFLQQKPKMCYNKWYSRKFIAVTRKSHFCRKFSIPGKSVSRKIPFPSIQFHKKKTLFPGKSHFARKLDSSKFRFPKKPTHSSTTQFIWTSN